ncbi:Cobalt-zinc-cadmium resistance protein CzcB [bacterium AB1]|nr:Cobalt-zinc-cadmium resistance protein CzcB [bacterium AB1]
MQRLLIFLFLLCISQTSYIIYKNDDLQNLIKLKEESRVESSTQHVVSTMVVMRLRFTGVFTTYGKIKALNHTMIKLPSNLGHYKAYVEKIFFQAGQQVKKGELLLTIACDEIIHKKNAIHKEFLQHVQYLKRLTNLKNNVAEHEVEKATLNAEKFKYEYQQSVAACEKLNIQAPFDGTIGHSNIVVGEAVSNEKNVAMLVNSKNLIVEFYVPSEQIENISTGASVIVESSDGDVFSEACITGIDPYLDDIVGKTKVIASLKFAPKSFKHNSNVNVSIDKKSVFGVYVVPKTAVIDDVNNFYVCKAEKRNGEYYTKLCRVQIIDSKGDSYAILSEGIKDGEKIIIEGVLKNDNVPVVLKDINN